LYSTRLGGFFRGGPRGVRQDIGGGAQVAWGALETDGEHPGLDVGEWFHIYDIHWSERFFGKN